MNYKEQLEVHYPISVMQRDFSGVSELNNLLLDNINQLEALAESNSNNAADSDSITTEGGFQTPLNFNFFEQNNEAVQRFKEELVLPAVYDYLKDGFKDVLEQIKPWPVGWANTLRNQNWQRPHFHPTHKNIISGVYYVKLPDDLEPPQGCIEFINPMPLSVHHGFSNTRRIQPNEGKLVLFPPFYMHYVHPVFSKKQRTVIAFDILSEPPGLQFVF